MSGLGLLQPMTRRALAHPSNRRQRRADRTGLPRLSRRARLAPALPPKQPLWPSHALLRASWVCPRAHFTPVPWLGEAGVRGTLQSSSKPW